MGIAILAQRVPDVFRGQDKIIFAMSEEKQRSSNCVVHKAFGEGHRTNDPVITARHRGPMLGAR